MGTHNPMPVFDVLMPSLRLVEGTQLFCVPHGITRDKQHSTCTCTDKNQNQPSTTTAEEQNLSCWLSVQNTDKDNTIMESRSRWWQNDCFHTFMQFDGFRSICLLFIKHEALAKQDGNKFGCVRLSVLPFVCLSVCATQYLKVAIFIIMRPPLPVIHGLNHPYDNFCWCLKQLSIR